MVGFKFCLVIWNLQKITFNFMDSHLNFIVGGGNMIHKYFIKKNSKQTACGWILNKEIAHIIMFRYF